MAPFQNGLIWETNHIDEDLRASTGQKQHFHGIDIRISGSKTINLYLAMSGLFPTSGTFLA